MAFFKFQKSGDEQSATPVQPESVEAMRKRAKYRLMGAAVLVVVGVIGFPLLFDKQPRPIAVDLPIDIPDKNKVKPLSIPAPAATQALKAEASAPAAPASTTLPKLDEKSSVPPVITSNDAPKSAVTAEPKPDDRVTEKQAGKSLPAVKAAAQVAESAKALALLEGRAPEKKAIVSQGRFVVQVGAFADTARAREARLKLEHIGLKTYTQVAETKDGRRIRVRVGPFDNKAEADKAAEKIKKLDLPAAILTL